MWLFFFVDDAATTEIYTYRHTLSLHDALPIFQPPIPTYRLIVRHSCGDVSGTVQSATRRRTAAASSSIVATCSRSEEHTSELQSLMRTSYAVFCLKKKIIITISAYPDPYPMLPPHLPPHHLLSPTLRRL